MKIKVEICGLLNSTEYHQALCCANDLFAKSPNLFSEPIATPLLELQWSTYLAELKKKLGGELWKFNDVVIVFIDGKFVGNAEKFIEWAIASHKFIDFRTIPLYQTLCDEAYSTVINEKPHVFMDFSIKDGDELTPLGRLVFALHHDKLPKTCENFKCLCTGEKGNSKRSQYEFSFKNSALHRIVKNGWIQGGDIWKSKGDGGESVFEERTFPDEGYMVSHDRRGIIGMANSGERHSNQSQFYITLQPMSWMDKKFVAFGEVVEGSTTLDAIEDAPTLNERPKNDIVITDCGIQKVNF